MKQFILIFILSSFIQAQPLKEKLEDDLNKLPHPASVQDFVSIPHLSSINQDSTLICWSFATSSFLESEMQRLGRDKVRLSVMFPVYYGFIEKARRFVQTHGESHFGPGDLFNGVLGITKQYGEVPIEAYEGAKTKQTVYNHNLLYEQLEAEMNKVKAEEDWSEEKVIEQVKVILNKFLNKPPQSFSYKGKIYSPKTFLLEVVNLPWDEYIMVTSFQYAPFNKFIELKVPDNWKHDSIFNVPLEEFYSSLTDVVKNGYSVAIDMDNSETSYRMTKRYAFVPEFETPKDSITQKKREDLFLSGATTDDHVMHIVSYKKFGNEDWFLAKDSWRTAWEGENKGYFFLHESYIKLKVLAYLVHRDGVPEINRRVAR